MNKNANPENSHVCTYLGPTRRTCSLATRDTALDTRSSSTFSHKEKTRNGGYQVPTGRAVWIFKTSDPAYLYGLSWTQMRGFAEKSPYNCTVEQKSATDRISRDHRPTWAYLRTSVPDRNLRRLSRDIARPVASFVVGPHIGHSPTPS